MQSALGNCRSHLCRYGGQMCACMYVGFPGGASKEPACQCKRCKRRRFDPWVGKIPWRRVWQTTPVFLPGELHGQRRMAGCSLWGHNRVRHNLAMKQQPCDHMKSLSRVRLFATPWTVTYQAPLSMGFYRQEYWSGLPFPSPGDLPNPGLPHCR